MSLAEIPEPTVYPLFQVVIKAYDIVRSYVVRATTEKKASLWAENEFVDHCCLTGIAPGPYVVLAREISNTMKFADFEPGMIGNIVQVMAYNRDVVDGDLIKFETRVEHVGLLQGYIKQPDTVHFWFQGFHVISINPHTHSYEVLVP